MTIGGGYLREMPVELSPPDKVTLFKNYGEVMTKVRTHPLQALLRLCNTYMVDVRTANTRRPCILFRRTRICAAPGQRREGRNPQERQHSQASGPHQHR